ncbi:MAG: hypothetical protein ACREAE_06840 [Nitrosopumilaceae archaeon]
MNNRFTVVGIDGKDGVGKSTLAVALANELELELVELDKHLTKNQGGYVDYIRYPVLDEILRNAKRLQISVIVEGICLIKVLERLMLKPDILIYVKRVMPDGFWYDSYYCEPNEKPEELLKSIKESNEKAHQLFGSPSKQDDLKFRIIEYHQEYKPTEMADYFFERVWKK